MTGYATIPGNDKTRFRAALSDVAVPNDERSFTELRDLRDMAIEHLDVLDVVKALPLIPQLDVMTTKQVAEYFHVDLEAIRKTYQRHKAEIDQDGAMYQTAKVWSRHLVQSKSKKPGTSAFVEESGKVFYINNRGEHCFPKRAVLRIAMLLRDSEISMQVRTHLLNVAETASPPRLFASA